MKPRLHLAASDHPGASVFRMLKSTAKSNRSGSKAIVSALMRLTEVGQASVGYTVGWHLRKQK